MNNNDKFNALINECENPQLMLSLLQLLFSRSEQEKKGGAQE